MLFFSVEGNDCHEFVHFRNLLTNMTDAQKRKLIGNSMSCPMIGAAIFLALVTSAVAAS